ncbi:hypothetical protein SNE40_010938 [Patella caerulea]|uniref:Lipocalin/cytosolic fatty-acid binding domain-containing protein n=1 Tax=Patella caerulea TaxID=87958 RepID=A0AAN8JVD0_PATCE
MDGVIIYAIVLLMKSVQTAEINCQVTSFKIQENFDLSKYLGTWYEIKWIAPFYHPEEDQWSDYQHTYRMKQDGGVAGYGSARKPPAMECVYFRNDLNRTSISGKFTFGENGSPYWVIKTDYTNFATVYGCSKQYANGTCSNRRIWIWGRETTLAEQFLKEAESAVTDVCVNTSVLVSTGHSEGCSVETNGSGSVLLSFSAMLLNYLILFVFK